MYQVLGLCNAVNCGSGDSGAHESLLRKGQRRICIAAVFALRATKALVRRTLISHPSYAGLLILYHGRVRSIRISRTTELLQLAFLSVRTSHPAGTNSRFRRFQFDARLDSKTHFSFRFLLFIVFFLAPLFILRALCPGYGALPVEEAIDGSIDFSFSSGFPLLDLFFFVSGTQTDIEFRSFPTRKDQQDWSQGL